MPPPPTGRIASRPRQAVTEIGPLRDGVHLNQTEWPPGSPAWSGSPGCLVAQRVEPPTSVGSAATCVAAAKSSFDGGPEIPSEKNPPWPPAESTAILYSTPAVTSSSTSLARALQYAPPASSA